MNKVDSIITGKIKYLDFEEIRKYYRIPDTFFPIFCEKTRWEIEFSQKNRTTHPVQKFVIFLIIKENFWEKNCLVTLPLWRLWRGSRGRAWKFILKGFYNFYLFICIENLIYVQQWLLYNIHLWWTNLTIC